MAETPETIQEELPLTETAETVKEESPLSKKSISAIWAKIGQMVILLIAFILVTANYFLSGILFLIVGLAMIPSIWEMWTQKLKTKIPAGAKTLFLIVMSFIACACLTFTSSISTLETSLLPSSTPVPVIDESTMSSTEDNSNEITAIEATVSGEMKENLEQALVTRIVDGDTVELSDGRKVRYIGIDTPEISGTKECFGDEAKAKNQALVENKTVSLEKDVSETDRYGRLLRYVYVDGQMVNELLVAEGYAQASTYQPDVKYQEKLAAAETNARTQGLGLWGTACQLTATPTPIPTAATTVSNFVAPVGTVVNSSPTSTAKASVNDTTKIVNEAAATNNGSYECNCDKKCKEISCAEAQYQLNTCGCSQRDGDGDGLACDSQCG